MGTKKANHGAVTSIADTDLVMVCTPSGKMQPVAFANLMAAVKGQIQIGGRNYFAMSKASAGNAIKEGYSLKMITADSRGFTLSVVVTNSDGSSASLYYGAVSEKGRKTFALNIPEGCTQLNIKHSGASRDFGATIPFTQSGKFMLGISFDSVTGLLAMSNIMLERGNIATDWTPAPEDLWGGGVFAICQLLTKTQRKGVRVMGTKKLTNQLLKEKMSDTLCNRTPEGYIANVDTCVTPGVYRISPNTQNSPFSGWGILEVIAGGDIVKQEAFALMDISSKFFRITNTSSFVSKNWTGL